MELTLTTPALLFSSISLIMLAYTNRFLAYANIIRNLHAAYKTDPNKILKAQIVNIRKRLYLTRSMQIFGITSLFLCVLSILIISLSLLIWEIQISVKALELHLEDIES
jgi:hypothetical protein